MPFIIECPWPRAVFTFLCSLGPSLKRKVCEPLMIISIYVEQNNRTNLIFFCSTYLKDATDFAVLHLTMTIANHMIDVDYVSLVDTAFKQVPGSSRSITAVYV